MTALYSLPFFLFLALPVALFIDFSSKTRERSCKMKILFYAGTGCLAGLLGAVIFGELLSGIDLGVYEIVGGLAYFGVLELLKLLFHKRGSSGQDEKRRVPDLRGDRPVTRK